MSIESMLTEDEKSLRAEMQAFVRSIPRQLLLDLDAEKLTYPREFLQEAARRSLLGLRFDPQWGGRGLPWTSELVALE
jgi:alkylation response protein AidB-like acyl-CoA dehydrogenase